MLHFFQCLFSLLVYCLGLIAVHLVGHHVSHRSAGHHEVSIIFRHQFELKLLYSSTLIIVMSLLIVVFIVPARMNVISFCFQCVREKDLKEVTSGICATAGHEFQTSVLSQPDVVQR